MRLGPLSTPDLERRLLRKAISGVLSDRDRCADCRRTPLVGERLHVYADGQPVCELCRPAHRGEAIRVERVLNSERGRAVRLRAA